jgi:hypothetical protein
MLAEEALTRRKENPKRVMANLLAEDGGLERLWSKYVDSREDIRNSLEKAYMDNNRDGAVKAGVLRGLRIGLEVLPGMALDEMRRETQEYEYEQEVIAQQERDRRSVDW